MNYFEQFGNEITEKSSLAYLREFKKDYGKLVSKNIELSTQMAKTIENTEIFDLLKNTAPTENDTKIVKEYIRAKLLPVFSEFKITEIENNLNWNAQKDTATKQRINVLLTKLNDQFETYKSRFVSSGETLQILTTDEMNNLFNLADNFFVEADAYFKALGKFNISKLAVDFDNDLEAYKKSNKLAEVYLELIGGREPGLVLNTQKQENKVVIQSMQTPKEKVYHEPRSFPATQEEIEAHISFLKKIPNNFWGIE